MSTFRADVVLALRGMRRHPVFSTLVALTLGLGIGANAAIFSAVNGLLLRPAPFKESDPRAIAAAATAAVGRIDTNQSFLDMQTYDDRLAGRMWQRRLAGALFLAFAALALVLAAGGLYGVLSEIVLQQRRDIGVRMALGAARGDVLRFVLDRGLRPAVAGLLIGLPLALVTARGFSGLLYGVAPYDPLILITVALLVLLIAVAACYVPARRALRIDPLVALRAE